jgi:hypothetical protein
VVQKEIVWVRWFDLDTRRKGGWKEKRLHRLQFFPSGHPSAFGFLDPKDIIRAVHLIPAFAQGITEDLLPHSPLARQLEEGPDLDESDDWAYYYVNM